MNRIPLGKKRSQRSLILCAVLLYLFAGNMISIFSTFIPYRDVLRMLITIVGFLTLGRISTCAAFSCRNVLLPMLVFVIHSCTVTALYYFGKTSNGYAALQCTDSVLWIAVFVLSYWIGMKGQNEIGNTYLFVWCVPIYAVLFLGVKAFSAGRGIPLISTAYYSLFLLPFVLLVRNRVVKWIGIALIFTTVLLSVKRGGFIGFILSMAVYFFVEVKVSGEQNPRKKYWTLVGGIVAAIALYSLFQYYTQTNSIGILQRITSISEDGGSGRTSVWAHTWSMIRDSSLIEWICGHGFNTVYMDSALQLSAHSDFLEVIYDYGVIGSVIYFIIISRLFKYYFYVRQKRKELAPAYAVSMVLWLCMSATAHLVIYTTHFLYLCVFWGLIIGEIDRERRIIIWK